MSEFGFQSNSKQPTIRIFHFFISFCIVTALLAFSGQAQASSLIHKAQLDYYGDVTDQFPELHRILTVSADKFARSASQLTGSNREIIPEIRFLDTGEELAQTLPYEGESPLAAFRYNAKIYISVGMIARIFSQTKLSHEQKVGILQLIIAHEIGHAVEKADPQGMHAMMTKLIAEYPILKKLPPTDGQYKEVHADTVAMLVARINGIEPSHILTGLEVFETTQEEVTIFASITSVHPRYATRTTFIEIVLAMLRQKYGSVRNSMDVQVSDAELSRISLNFQRYKNRSWVSEYWNRVRTLAQVQEELHAYQPPGIDLNIHYGTKFLAFPSFAYVHVAFSKAHAILDLKADATVADYLQLIQIVENTLRHAKPLRLLTQNEVQSVFSNFPNYSREVLAMGNLQSSLSQTSDAKARLMIDALKETRRKADSMGAVFYRNLPLLISIPQLVRLDPEFATDCYNDQLRFSSGGVEGLAESDPHGRSALVMLGQALGAGIATNARNFEVDQERVPLEQLTRTHIYSILYSSRSGASFRNLVPTFTPNGRQPPEESSQRRAQLMRIRNDQSPESLRLRSVLEAVWNHRGHYGLLDLTLQYDQIDWHFIFAVLNIEPEIGFASLRQSVIELTSSREYASVLRELTDAAKRAPRPTYVQHRPDVAHRDKISNAHVWWNAEVLESLRGSELPPEAMQEIRSSEDLSSIFGELVATSTLMTGQEAFLDYYKQLLIRHVIAPGAQSTRDVLDGHLQAMRETQAWRTTMAYDFGTTNHFTDGARLYAERWDSGIANQFLQTFLESDREDKFTMVRNFWHDLTEDTALAREILSISSFGVGMEETKRAFRYRWINYSDADKLESNIELLTIFGIFDPAKIFEFLQQHKIETGNAVLHYSLVGLLRQRIEVELETRLRTIAADQQKQFLLNFVQEFFNPTPTQDPSSAEKAQALTLKAGLPPGIDELRMTIWNRLVRFNPSTEEMIAFLEYITTSSPSPRTDEILEIIIDRISQESDSVVKQRLVGALERALSGGSAFNPSTKVKAARLILEPDLQALVASRSTRGVELYFEKVARVIPGKSTARDEFLDEVSYILNLSIEETKAFVSMLTMSEYRSFPPQLVAMVSGMQTLAEKMTDSELRDILDFTLKKTTTIPDWLISRLIGTGSEIAREQLGMDENWISKGEAAAKTSAESSKQHFSHMVANMSAENRAIFVLALLKPRGQDALKLAEELIPRYLGFQTDSAEFIQLTSFLFVVPKHERLLALSFILSHSASSSSSGRRDYAKVAEVFKAPGIKLAQLLSIWRVFSREISERLAEAKDNTTGMDRLRILEVFRNEADSTTRSQIRIVRRIRSASLKTIVEGEYTSADGTRSKVAVALLDPDADAQNEENLRLMRDYIETLRRRGTNLSNKFFADLLADFESVLKEETDLRTEARKITMAADAYDRVQARMQNQMDGWKFKVPRVIDGLSVGKNLMVMEFAKGIPFDELKDPELKRAVGSYFIQSQLQMIFREGILNPDFHSGNILVDPATRTIAPIDWGQAVRLRQSGIFQSDELYNVVRLFEAIKNNNGASVDQIMSMTSELLKNAEDAAPEKLRDLRRRIERALQEGEDTSSRIQKVIISFSEADLPLKEFYTLKAMKGLLVLIGENYVDQDTFVEFFTAEARRYVALRKPYRYGMDRLRGMLGLLNPAENAQVSSISKAALAQPPSAESPPEVLPAVYRCDALLN